MIDEKNIEKSVEVKVSSDVPLAASPDESTDTINEILDEVRALGDLFVRRLAEDKQKNVMIQELEKKVNYNFIEPFLSDLILVLDRLEKFQDEFAVSVYDEIYSLLERRGFKRIEIDTKFDPSLYKAIKLVEDEKADALYISDIIRNGYTFAGKVIRPAEVIVARPSDTTHIEEE